MSRYAVDEKVGGLRSAGRERAAHSTLPVRLLYILTTSTGPISADLSSLFSPLSWRRNLRVHHGQIGR